MSAPVPTRRRCAVLGSPIAHSLSPVLHRAAYAALGLDWSYDAVEVDEAGLAGFVGGLDDSWRGLSLTMPLKRTVLGLLDTLDDDARITGAANTVLIGDRGLAGANTDVPGAVAALRERGVDRLRSVAIWGAGATAASVAVAAHRLGCRSVTLLARDPARAERTRSVLAGLDGPPAVEVRVLGEPVTADLLVSTVPAEAQTAQLVASVIAPVVFEVRYDPWPTPVVDAARADGSTVVGGLDLLVHQAVEQVRLMTGADAVPLEAMRAAGERELAARASA